MRRALFAILLIAACSQKPEQQLQEAASWSATLQLTAEKWLDNSVPSSFVRSTVDAAMKSVEKTSTKSPAIDKLIAASGDFRHAIETNDRHAVAACAARFAEVSRELKK